MADKATQTRYSLLPTVVRVVEKLRARFEEVARMMVRGPVK